MSTTYSFSGSFWHLRCGSGSCDVIRKVHFIPQLAYFPEVFER